VAAGCGACHVAPGEKLSENPVLAGGKPFPSPFGTFYAPNISTDSEHGIGSWTAQDLLNALHHGTAPDGRHYYPAFPFTTYSRMTVQDAADLHGYLMTLPPASAADQPHDVGFPFSIRRGLGLWKRLFLSQDWATDSTEERGRYLVEALGHCSECHTPRNALGGLNRDAWLTGAPNPAGKGEVPGLHPNQLGWSIEDLVYYFQTGLTPDYDSVGGAMAEVIEGLSTLPEEDLRAIARYLGSLPPSGH